MDRLQLIERNAWERYRKALARAKARPSGAAWQAAIDAGAAWERADAALWNRNNRLPDVARAGRL